MSLERSPQGFALGYNKYAPSALVESIIDGGGIMQFCRKWLGLLPLLCLWAVSVLQSQEANSLIMPGERHFKSLRQLTFGGENAEAYWSPDGKYLIFQAHQGKGEFDQIYIMEVASGQTRLVSSGQGVTTCSYFFPDGSRILYASTHHLMKDKPWLPDLSQGYTWPVYKEYDIFSAKPDGSDLVQLTSTMGYDAEATIAPDGSKVVFTSVRDGDLELYTMNLDGSEVRRITHSPGYDGGAFFSHDSRKIVWRAQVIEEPKEQAEFRRLLEQELVRPTDLEIFVANVDGSDRRQVTHLGKANWAPFFHPSDQKILFCSNHHAPPKPHQRPNFDLFLVDLAGHDLERITFYEDFDSFPMFSPDGRYLVFSSNRGGKERSDTNLFLAEWIDDPESQLPGLSAEKEIEAGELISHISFLANPALAGRGAGTAGAELAATYISLFFQQLGLEPLSQAGFLQPFLFQTDVEVIEKQPLLLRYENAELELPLDKSFTPLSFSASGSLEGPVVFAGYGISAPHLSCDDYQGLEVRERIVLVFRREPREGDPHSPFVDKGLGTFADLRYKASNARDHGAKAVVFVTPPSYQSDQADALIPLSGSQQYGDAGIPVVQVRRETLDGWLTAQGVSLASWQKLADAGEANKGRLPNELRLLGSVKLLAKKAATANVVGLLPGSDAELRQEFIVLGAHYDHLGLGLHGRSLAEQTGQPHLGADDNASGIAALLALARACARSKARPRRSLLFIAFGAEEIGLLGSNYFVNHAPIDLKQVGAMINLDMVGRLKDDALTVSGLKTAQQWEKIVVDHNQATPFRFRLALLPDGYGPSDHTSFYCKDIPVLALFTGLHADYHRPSDHWEKIQRAGLVRISRYVYRLTRSVDALPQRLTFTRFQGSTPPSGEGVPVVQGDAAWFGSIPDYSSTGNDGVRCSGIQAESPAAKAGLLAGDTLVAFDGKPLRNLHDFTYFLRSRRPGQTVRVQILRDGQTLEMEVVLGRRSQMRK